MYIRNSSVSNFCLGLMQCYLDSLSQLLLRTTIKGSLSLPKDSHCVYLSACKLKLQVNTTTDYQEF